MCGSCAATRPIPWALKYTKNAFDTGTLPQTLLGELTALPQTLTWIQGDCFVAKGREGKGVSLSE